ncbi:thioredoxin family protein [Arcobacter sp. FWKO B]|uniref:thioredoxin family protein n=1 Tax=Arcobacter sp. FWKO B TaxID=2593672 RepID=UPI0018A4B103|nr:thioredoxin fold domain-containing protein [Arcobacter sp. FWKO B]QOG12553.1 DUF255 domain-containing protein [Arcobacter sp. FWKO B]
MKKILGLIFVFSTFLLASSIQSVFSLEKAKEIAKKEDKLILAMFTMENCPTCEYMKDVAFEDKMLSGYINGYFVLYEIDYHKKDTFPQGLSAFGTPTFYILDSSGNRIGRAIVGGTTANVFLDKLKEYRK